MNISASEKLETQKKVSKPILYVGIVSIVMFFAGLTSAYIVRQAEGNWLVFPFPAEFYASTILIGVSSLTMILAQRSMAKNNAVNAKNLLGLTLLFGIGFIITQLMAWNALTENSIYLTGPSANASGSFLYVLCLMHLAHLVGGIIALIVTYLKASRLKYSSENMLGIELCAIYWHFLGILWLYLLLFFLFIR